MLAVDPRASQRGASLRILLSIARHEAPSPLRALYRGFTPNAIGNTVSWAVYFFWYNNLKTILHGLHPTSPLTSLDYLVSSTASGILTATLTNPIWVLKTRFLTTPASSPLAYRSLAHGVWSILKEERGWKGFYRGLVPSLAGVSHGGVQFVVYEKLKEWRRGSAGRGELTNWDYLGFSAVAKGVAGVVTYPYQVVRTRLQNYEAGEGSYVGDRSGRKGRLREVVKGIWEREGGRGFYKGLGTNLVRVLPSAMVTFVVYENVRWYLPGLIGSGQEESGVEGDKV